jgi:acetyl-CoA carboxylase biotin carboxyl carrier protein
MAARPEKAAHAVCGAADVFEVPILGMAGTPHEAVYPARGQTFVAGFNADLAYADDGTLVRARARASRPAGRGQAHYARSGTPPEPWPAPQPHAAVAAGRKPRSGEPVATKQILSPLPGIFYRRPAPDRPPYKNEGDPVAEGDVIGLIEVMKSFHEVKADASGTLARFLLEDEDPVDAGQPIAELDA